MKILDRLPYFDETTYLTVGASPIEVRRYQIVVWVSLNALRFPAVLDTGHTHNFTICERQLKRFASLDSLPIIGHVDVNRQLLPQLESNVWLHGNRRGTREPNGTKVLLIMDEGITLYPDGAPATPRLPLLGLRALTRNDLKLTVYGRTREVSVSSPPWWVATRKR